MFQRKIGIAALMLLPLATLAAEPKGLSFQHHDWQLVCDNTRTCRAAGYQREEREEGKEDEGVEPVSVLLTRKAGPREPVRGELMLGEGDTLQRLPQPLKVGMRVNGKSVGSVTFARNAAVAVLSPQQVAAMLAVLPRKADIEWRVGDARWRLSDQGAAAVLLKMDEFQGRVSTPGALVRKGSTDEASVLPPVPAPVVRARTPDDTDPKINVAPALYEALRATLANDDDDCHQLKERETRAEDVTLIRLDATHLLASAQCWMAAYNMGIGYWVVQDRPPYRPVLVTASGSDYGKGRIYAAHKGRGIGDCWSNDDWVWDGARFVHTLSATTGLCRLVAPGGAWSLPTLVSEVK